MKKIVSLLAIFLCVSATFAQAPNKMSYQSIIRDVDGALLTEKKVTVQISILKGSKTGDAVYVENHSAATNKNGLLSFEIGGGEIVSGQFSKIEWADGAYYIKTATDPNGGSDFSIVGISEFLSVPYALSARIAENAFSGNYDDLKNKPTRLSQFTNDIGITAADSFNRGPGAPASAWLLQGNSASNPLVDKLGTTDYKDLVMVTNNVERLRITKDGDINISNNLSSNDLYVKRNVFLNTVSGATINNGNFTVANNKPTNLTGLLDVDRTLNVDGITTLQSALNVNNMAPTSLTGSLVVKKNGTFEKNVFVTDTLFAREIDLKRLNVKDNVPDGKYVAVFENTNNGTGDGIKIILGKNATKRGGGFDAIDSGLRVFVGQGFGPDKFSSIKALFDGSINAADGQFLAEMLVPDTEDAQAIAASACRLSEQLSRLIFQQLNSTLDLPVEIGALCVTLPLEIGRVCMPGFSNDVTLIPALPTDLSFGCDVLGSGFQFPTFSFADQSNILDSENSFVEFTDKTGWRMGAVKAQSIDEWAAQYLDPVFLYNLYATFKGLDKSQIFPEIRKTAKEAAESYLQIGVEYSSGNGDYAEWLERVDPNEIISAGDVVAVKGGKITKDLANAEQVMGVSHRPIVLGNVPKAGMNEKGNNVAFMGQIPVKIMGSVRSGDYIVGKSTIPEFGIAVHPENMTVEDFKLAIGRSWDTNLDAGAKMTNTVVGVHNGDYINILKKMDEKIRFSESRLESVEAKIDALSASLSEVKRNN